MDCDFFAPEVFGKLYVEYYFQTFWRRKNRKAPNLDVYYPVQLESIIEKSVKFTFPS